MAATWIDRSSGAPVHLSTAAGTFTFSLGGRSNLSFDGEGRLVGAWFDHITYRRGLDNRVLEKRVDATGVRRRRLLDDAERRALLDRAYAEAGRLASHLGQGILDPGTTEPGLVTQVEAWLEAIGKWDWTRLEAEKARFAAVYKPVSILPPDQYLALVIQATEGCSYNRCSFCTFYRDRPFRIKSPPELRSHIDAVRDLVGAGMGLRRSLFLADANAVMVSQSRLLPILEKLNDCFTVLQPGKSLPLHSPDLSTGSGAFQGINAFVSAPDALRKSVMDFRALARLNLRRLYVGLETGHDPLRRFLYKEGSGADVLAAVEAILAGGVNVGLIVMVGIGGDRYRDDHLADTIDLIRNMPLGRNDLVYLSPFVASPDTPYIAEAASAGIRPLDRAALLAEEKRFRHALLPWARRRGVRISRYDIREFIY